MFPADELVMSRIPESGLNDMNINDYIAALTHKRDCPMSQQVGISESLGKSIGAYVYLRDNYDAKTYGEALQILRKRKVKPAIIELMIEEEIVGKDGTFDAISQGYPEYAEWLKDLRNESIDRILNKE